MRPVTSSIGSHADHDGIAVTIYLSQPDIDLLNVGMPVDIDVCDDMGATLSVHVIRERQP